MKRTVAIAFAAALLCHALLLFGFHAGDVARPLPLSDTPQTVDVTLVDAVVLPPEPSPPEATPPAPEPTPNIAPTPAPTPEPLTPAELPPPQPEPEPSAAPQPLPSPAPKSTATPKPAIPRPAQPVKTSTSAQQPARQSARPRYRSNPSPKYPEAARRNGEQGVVVISALVEADGHPSRVSLKQSCGFPLLDAAALEAVRKWTFDPARAGGLPSASHVNVPVRFALNW